jgi:hypothetical protein
MSRTNGSTYDEVPPSLSDEEWEDLFALADANGKFVPQPFINVLMFGNSAPTLAVTLSHIVIELHGQTYTVLKDKRTRSQGVEFHIDTLPMFLRILEKSYGAEIE